jgi:hypothetical protein
MKKWIIAIALLPAVSGCGPSLSDANERGGIVTHAGGGGGPLQNGAFDLANEHCKKYGRMARISGIDAPDNKMTFACVQP